MMLTRGLTLHCQSMMSPGRIKDLYDGSDEKMRYEG